LDWKKDVERYKNQRHLRRHAGSTGINDPGSDGAPSWRLKVLRRCQAVKIA